MPHDATQVLRDSLNTANMAEPASLLSADDVGKIKRIADCACRNQNKSTLAVLMTLLVKKVMKPSQDVRKHQAKMTGGFSGRNLDKKHVTPFLRENDFPHMSESGWLTRSFEHPSPYDLNYPGEITPAFLRNDFLSLVDKVERKSGLAKACLEEVFRHLVSFREQSQDIALSRPKNQSVEAVVSLVGKLWDRSTSGRSRIPVIAVFAAYQCLVDELDRYKNHQLLPLLAHNAPDQKTGRTGDIDLKHNSKIVEGVEIKHGVRITPKLVAATIEKIKRTTVTRYYILSTNEKLEGVKEITDLTTDARHNHGCEIIVNGVAATLKYYLRLVSNTDDFIENFVSTLEKDNDIGYELKMTWDQIANEQ